MTTIDTATITVELPDAFDPRWSRLPGIQVDGRRITIDPAESAVEQLALDFIKDHGEPTSDAARVLATAYGAHSYLFPRGAPGRPRPAADHRRPPAHAAAATLMAFNKIELDGHISNVGPCWSFPAATSVVFDLDDATGCQSVPDHSGGVIAPYGASMANFLARLAESKAGSSSRPTPTG